MAVQFCNGPGDEAVLQPGGVGFEGPATPTGWEQGKVCVRGVFRPSKCCSPGGGSGSQKYYPVGTGGVR